MSEADNLGTAGASTDPIDAPIPSPMGDTTPAMDWKAPFGDDPAVSNFNSPEDFARSYNEAQNMIRRSIRIPTEDAGDDVVNAFYEKLQSVNGVTRLPYDEASQARFNASIGVPEKPDGYNWTEVEGFQDTPESDSEFRNMAHTLGMTPKQADGIRQYLASHIVQGQSMMAQKSQEGINGLRQEWGAAFEHKTQQARHAVNFIEQRMEGFSEWLETTGNGDDPMVIRLMATIAELGGEAQAGLPVSPAGVMTPYDAQIQIKEMRDNQNHPFNNETDPAHKAAVQKMQELYRYAYPEGR